MRLITGTALTIGGALLAASGGSAPDVRANCEVTHTVEATQTRTYSDPAREGDQTGVQTREVSKTYETCAGNVARVRTVQITPWSEPTGFSY